jgi:hypothetical protein
VSERTVVQIDRDNIRKLIDACRTFGSVPYFAIVVDAGNTIRCFIVTMPYLIARSGKAKGLYWGMRLKDLERYLIDQKVISFEFESKTIRWWSS